MSDTVWALLLGSVLLALAVNHIKYLAEYCRELRRVKKHLNQAETWKELVFWRGELSALRWSFLPGLTPERVKRIKSAFYQGKHAKKAPSDGLSGVLFPSVLGMFLCSVCLAGSTYAWFSASQSVPTQMMQTARYDVTVSITAEEEKILPQGEEYLLSAGRDYTVTLTAKGDAATGFCILSFGKETLHTAQFPRGTTQGEVFVFTLSPTEDTTLKITPQWGTSAKKEADKIGYGTIYPKPPENTQPSTDTGTDISDTSPSDTSEETTKNPVTDTGTEPDTEN